MTAPDHAHLHASAVAHGQRGLLILGSSGSGKSSLALRIIALGARLVADDQTIVERRPEGPPVLRAPQATEGLIEARGAGLIRLPHTTAYLAMAVDLDVVEEERLPRWHTHSILGAEIPLLRKVESPAFPSILWLCLTGERIEP